MAFKDLNVAQKIVAVHLDIMRHPDFTLMGGVTQIGKTHVFGSTEDLQGLIEHVMVPTAGTDGCDVYYNATFCAEMSREELRYLVLHESGHKGFRHCTEYEHIRAKHPEEFAQAIDYVTNDWIESVDPGLKFVARPKSVPPLIDPKFHDMSVPQVVKMLIDEKDGKGKEPEGPEGEGGKPGEGKGGTPGRGKPMDTHIQPKDGKKPGQDSGLTPEELKKQITDAINQGAIVSAKLRGVGGGGQNVGGFQERNTDWRTPLRRFVSETCEGYDNSTFSPRNRLYVPHGLVMPSHFSEMTGELIVACDTSGSMGGLYPTVFGEIANICKTVTPEKVRVIWWGDHIEGEQVFLPKDYDKIKDLMKPKGGGGTTVSCVAKHVEKMKYKPKATIMLSDGYVESQYECVPGPLLWGVVDNESFLPIRGKVIHISSMNEGV